MAVVSMKALLETGVHFGHRTRRWNPKMKPYIFTERNGVHIIDLQQTITALGKFYEFVRDMVGDGGTVLFVGTKRQAQETIAQEAQRCGMPYVNHRWLGGTLTNWRTIRQRIDYLLNLEARRDRGDFERLTKKEALGLQRQIEKLNNRLGGIREMRDLPDLLYVVDVRREATAVAEANKLAIPILAIVDTNCNPDPIDYVIPANDDAIRAIKLITSLVADAVLEGVAQRKAYEPEGLEGEEIGIEDEKYLSAATLARLKELTFEGQVEEEEAVPVAEAAQAEEVAEAEPEGEPEDEKVIEEVEEAGERVEEERAEPVPGTMPVQEHGEG
ncbi:MAG: 30S ribosomal protein S2 [Chloroflexota bacterium]|nr:30S ribosomal protein S2 [Chloroflexota bacterium]